MKHRSLGKIIFTFMIFLPTLCSAQLLPHIKTFGFDYGNPQTIENLEFIATHHDALVTGVVSEYQYDTMKSANQNVQIFNYVVNTAFSSKDFEDVCRQWAIDNGLDPESIYIHYYYDNVGQFRSTRIKTSGTGTIFDRICDENGVLLKDGESGIYYQIWGYGGGSAKTLLEARAYQVWNQDPEPRVNHLSPAFLGGYIEWCKRLMTIAPEKYTSGFFIDTYDGPVSTRYQKNMHHIIELRDLGYSADDTQARRYYTEQMALFLGKVKDALITYFKNPQIVMVPNTSELGVTYYWSKEVIAEQIGEGKIESVSMEYLTSPSKTTYLIVDSYFKKFYDDISTGVITSYNQVDTAWYQLGKIPPLGGKQFMIGSLYLFNHPSSHFGIHYGTASAYGPGVTPNIGEAKGGKFSDSHWDKMLEFDIGIPVEQKTPDFWGISGTDRMYVVEDSKEAGRIVLARKYTKALVMVRFEKSDNNNASDLGTDPRPYKLDGNYRRLLEDNSFGPTISEITLGKSEGAIMIMEEFAKHSWEGPAFDPQKTILVK